MAQYYTVERAFLATQEDKTTPEVINSRAGACHKYIFKVEGESNWFNILRKIGEDGQSKKLDKGDQVYGEIAMNNYGKLAFNRMSEPQDGERPAAQAPSNVPTPQSSNLEQKLDYIISLLENNAQFQGPRSESQTDDVVLEDIDDGPVDLSNLNY